MLPHCGCVDCMLIPIILQTPTPNTLSTVDHEVAEEEAVVPQDRRPHEEHPHHKPQPQDPNLRVARGKPRVHRLRPSVHTALVGLQCILRLSSKAVPSVRRFRIDPGSSVAVRVYAPLHHIHLPVAGIPEASEFL
jgi:hypothetical protein